MLSLLKIIEDNKEQVMVMCGVNKLPYTLIVSHAIVKSDLLKTIYENESDDKKKETLWLFRDISDETSLSLTMLYLNGFLISTDLVEKCTLDSLYNFYENLLFLQLPRDEQMHRDNVQIIDMVIDFVNDRIQLEMVNELSVDRRKELETMKERLKLSGKFM